ncbi:MAG: phytoene desaturase family protein [Pirellulaceae bacterium]
MIKPNNPSVGIVGGGLGGLTAACTLASRGYRVTVFERNRWIGGKAAVLEGDGFRFDMGPTILLMPSVLRKVFAEAGEAVEDHLQLISLDPQWRSFFSDGSTLDLVRDTPAMQAEVERFGGTASARGYSQFMDTSRRLHDISDRYFFWKSVGGIPDTFQATGMASPQVLRDLWSLRMGRTVGGVVRSHIADPRVAQMVDHFTQYVGSAPDASPAVLCGIAHMQTDEGVWYPEGGTAAVPRALRSLAERVGIKFVTGTQVKRIVTADNRVAGLQTDDGDTHEFDAVVSNSDVVRTNGELLAPKQRNLAGLPGAKAEPACSGVVLYLGLRERYEHLLHHNFVFSQDPHQEFDQIYRRGEPADDPTCYLCAPGRTDPSVAPKGGEALYVLVHTPYLHDHHDWQAMFPKYREIILKKLAETANLTDLEERIEFESALTPEDIDRRYHVWKGAIYGLASHGRFLGAFKSANRNRGIHGFYLAGGSAHPGPGMPMAMMSGWIAADSLDRDFACVGPQANVKVPIGLGS